MDGEGFLLEAPSKESVPAHSAPMPPPNQSTSHPSRGAQGQPHQNEVSCGLRKPRQTWDPQEAVVQAQVP